MTRAISTSQPPGLDLLQQVSERRPPAGDQHGDAKRPSCLVELIPLSRYNMRRELADFHLDRLDARQRRKSPTPTASVSCMM